MVTYVKGDATKPIGGGKKIIAHICNDDGGWGAGFVKALDKISPNPQKVYRQWHSYWTKKSQFFTFVPLGTVQWANAGEDIIVANMIAQHRTIAHVEKPICYKSLQVALSAVRDYAISHNCTVHMPRIGIGLARGDWSVIESIINRTLTLSDVEVIVYDL
jgi:O-acetyl-ADP-ribose deacetylase (regulator of RNase III)